MEILHMKSSYYNREANSLENKLSKTLKFISRLKNYEIRQNDKKSKKHSNTMGLFSECDVFEDEN